MTKIENTKGGAGVGYSRIFGNKHLGRLFSRVHATSIRAGNALEEILISHVPDEMQTSLDELGKIVQAENKAPVQIVFKPTKSDPENPKKYIKADFLIVHNQKRLFMLVEMKDGSTFDTKKSDGELASLKNITNWLATEYPYRADYFICAFNEDDKEVIMRGFKNRFTEQHIMTGREFCENLGVDYKAVKLERESDQVQNRMYFLRKLLEIEDIRSEIYAILDEIET